MKAVEKGEMYDLIEPSTKKAVGQLNAKEVFDKIVYAAWRNGEPGIIFLDRLNRDNVVPAQGEIESTNPCGEQPLLPYESCNLGSINLVKMIEKGPDGRYSINWNKLADTIGKAVHFLDNVIDANQYPLPQIDFTTKQTRKIGLDVYKRQEGDREKFWKIFDERLELCYRALMCRHERLRGTLSDAAPILWQYGACARLKKGEPIDKLLVLSLIHIFFI